MAGRGGAGAAMALPRIYVVSESSVPSQASSGRRASRHEVVAGGWRVQALSAIEDEGESDDGTDDALVTATVSVLASVPMFKGCPQEFLRQIVLRAPKKTFQVGESLESVGEDALFLQSGALEVEVGSNYGAAPVCFGPGWVCNAQALAPPDAGIGSPDLEEQEQEADLEEQEPNFEQRPLFGPYEVEDDAMPPWIFKPLAEPGARDGGNSGGEDFKAEAAHRQRLREESACLYSLCPQACEPRTSSKDSSTRAPLTLMVRATEGMIIESGDPAQLLGSSSAQESRGPISAVNQATILLLSRRLFEEAAQEVPGMSPAECLQPFEANSHVQGSMFQALRLLGSNILPDAPREVLWKLAEVASLERVAAGEQIVNQGQLGFAGKKEEALVILKRGCAAVERHKASGEVAHVGRLGPGAVIGELCLLGANIAHAASVRALTEVEAVVLPAQSLQHVLSRFPGALLPQCARLDEVRRFLQASQPAPSEALRILPLFADEASAPMVEALAGAADACAYFLALPIKQQGAIDSNLYLIHQGTVAVECVGRGRVDELAEGSFFGERGFSACGARANATFRATTPVVLLFRFCGDMLSVDVRRACGERLGRAFAESGKRGSAKTAIGNIEAFRMCSAAFQDSVSEFAELRSYMPGQLLIEESAQDAGQTFVVLAGSVATEKDGRKIAEVKTGASFGELLMLGLSSTRRVSMRAQTFCKTIEIPRESFQLACARHPEENHFDQFCRKAAEKQADTGPSWRIGEDMPVGFCYSLNVASERKTCEVYESITASALGDRAIHLISGEADVKLGTKFIIRLRDGDLFNQERLLGLREQEETFVPLQRCDIQILQKNSFDYTCALFWDQAPDIRRALINSLLPRLQGRHSWSDAGNGASTMQLCAFFRVATPALSDSAFENLDVVMIEPGDPVCIEGTESDRGYFLLEGAAQVLPPSALGGPEDAEEVLAPAVFCNAQLLKTQLQNPVSVFASRLCVVGVLSRQALIHAMQACPQNPKLGNGLCREVQDEAELTRWLSQSVTFSGLPEDFMAVLCCGAEHLFFAPGEVVVRRGDECTLGKTACYMILAGMAEVESDNGVFLDFLKVGDVFGEAGALGLVEERKSTVRAKVSRQDHCLLHVVSLVGKAVVAACRAFPEVRERLVELFITRGEQNMQMAAQRKRWLQEKVRPHLGHVSLFAMCSMSFREAASEIVRVQRFKAGAKIFKVGEEADTLIIVIHGTVELQTKHGETVGRFGPGASFGEAAVLGLLEIRPSTLRAQTAGKYAELSAEALRSLLQDPKFERARDSVDFLRKERREQGSMGLPMSALPLHVNAGDVCARMAALTAARILIPPNALWRPLRDSCPDGPHLGVLSRGRVRLQIAGAARWVARLSGGSLVPEGLIAEYRAEILGEVSSEAYRIRQSDLVVAASASIQEGRAWSGSKAPMQDWYDRLRLLEKDICTRLRARFEVARGAEEASSPSLWALPADSSCASGVGRQSPLLSRCSTAPGSIRGGGGGGVLTPSRASKSGRRLRKRSSWAVCGSPDDASPAGASEGDWAQQVSFGETGGGGGGGGSTVDFGAGHGKSTRSTLRRASSGSCSTLPMLGPSRPGSSAGQTKAFVDESGCVPGDLLVWTLPGSPQNSRPSRADPKLRVIPGAPK